MYRYKNNILKIKRILILFPVFCMLFFPSTTFAGQCLIEDKPADVIINYIDTLRQVVNNITDEISENNSKKIDDNGVINKVKKDFKKDSNTIHNIFNQAINWNGYFSSFHYYAIFPVTDNVPYQIMRDHNIIEKEQEGLKKYLKAALDMGYGDIELVNTCNGIQNCELKGSLIDVIGELIINTSKVANLYRETVIGKNAQNQDTFILTPPSFRLQLEKYYGGDTLDSCSRGEGGFFETIWNSIKQIGINIEDGDFGVKKWKEAIAMMQGIIHDSTSPEAEKRILLEGLSGQGLSVDQRDTVLKNLERYNNSSGVSNNFHFLTSTYNSLKDSLTSQWDTFKESLGDVFEKKETATIADIQKAKEKSDISLHIEQSIEQLYQSQLQLMPMQDVNTAQTRLSIIKTHINLYKSIEVLEKTEKTAEIVCNSQAGNIPAKCSTKK